MFLMVLNVLSHAVCLVHIALPEFPAVVGLCSRVVCLQTYGSAYKQCTLLGLGRGQR